MIHLTWAHLRECNVSCADSLWIGLKVCEQIRYWEVWRSRSMFSLNSECFWHNCEENLGNSILPFCFETVRMQVNVLDKYAIYSWCSNIGRRKNDCMKQKCGRFTDPQITRPIIYELWSFTLWLPFGCQGTLAMLSAFCDYMLYVSI